MKAPQAGPDELIAFITAAYRRGAVPLAIETALYQHWGWGLDPQAVAAAFAAAVEALGAEDGALGRFARVRYGIDR